MNMKKKTTQFNHWEIKGRKLNFGCGSKGYEGFYNVDIIKADGIDQSFDFDQFPYSIKDDQFNYVLLNQVLEHCLYPKRVLEELRRICKDKAMIEIKSPCANSRTALCELDHCSQFNRWSFLNLNGMNKNGIKEEKFKIIQNRSNPQRFIKWIPIPILNFLSYFLDGIYVDIHVIVEVIKDNPKKK